jgi:hypothetical protein
LPRVPAPRCRALFLPSGFHQSRADGVILDVLRQRRRYIIIQPSPKAERRRHIIVLTDPMAEGRRHIIVLTDPMAEGRSNVIAWLGPLHEGRGNVVVWPKEAANPLAQWRCDVIMRDKMPAAPVGERGGRECKATNQKKCPLHFISPKFTRSRPLLLNGGGFRARKFRAQLMKYGVP